MVALWREGGTVNMNHTTATLPAFDQLVKPFQFPASPHEYKVTSLKECPTPERLLQCDTPDKAADYWRIHIAAVMRSTAR